MELDNLPTATSPRFQNYLEAPDEAKACCKRASYEMAHNQFADAIADLEMALKLKPDDLAIK
jgi:hypothetical protein